METLRRTRLFAVRLGLLLTVLAAGAAFVFSPAAAQGLAMGGIAGVLVFWVFALRVEKAAQEGRAVQSLAYTFGLLRLLVYGAVLTRALYLDREHYTALLGAVAGLFVIRAVLVFLAFTGLDLRQEEK